MGKKNREPAEQVSELIVPKEGELLGIVSQAVGASQFRVKCADGFERLCSIPGRLKRQFWIKEGDVVLVKPWIVQNTERGDIVWRYSLGDRERLLAKGYGVPE
ncbi:MAG: translation initiation factor eIF-1A [Candidatus Micrarchaeaceae archaeon]